MSSFLVYGDNRRTLPSGAENSIDAVVTDPPYGLSKEPDMVEVLKHWLAGDDHVTTSAPKSAQSLFTNVLRDSIVKDAQNLDPGESKECVTFRVTLALPLLPVVDSVYLQDRVAVREKEVSDDGSVIGVEHLLVNERDTHLSESLRNGQFRLRVREGQARGVVAGTVTRQGDATVVRVAIRLSDDAVAEPERSSDVVAVGGTELSAVLALDVTRRTGELCPADPAAQVDARLILERTHLVGAGPRAGGLSSEPQSGGVGDVAGSADGTVAFDVEVWLPVGWHESQSSGPGGFMGKTWDSFVPGPSTWREVYRVLKPGGYVLMFSGTRTWDMATLALRLAGFEIRDTLMWMYGCLDPDTEVLVDGEWVQYHKVRAGQHALCYDAIHDEFAWGSIERVVVKLYCDTAYRVVGARTDQLVTRDHRCLIERDGAFVFECAEEAARQRETCVPVVEDMSGLLDALSLPDQRASCSQRELLASLCADGESTAEENVHEREGWHGGVDMPLRSDLLATESLDRQSAGSSLLQEVQWDGSGQGVGEARPQGVGGGDDRVSGTSGREDEGRQESGLEGRGDLLSQEGQLRQADQVRSLSTGVCGDGAQGRLRDGASSCGGESAQSMSVAPRGCASHGSRPDEQRDHEPGPVRNQQRSQAVRGERFTSADLVRFEPVDYDGIVWCLTVPTGAFVVRRNGKVFVTGNSGFPKSLDVSKAIDKAAGAEREVVGISSVTGARLSFTIDDGKGYTPGRSFQNKDEVVNYRTASSTDAAQQWEGWGTALKPAWEPIVLARKPFNGTVAANVLTYGTGALNIDGARIGYQSGEVDFDRIQRQQHSGGAIEGAFGAASLIGSEIPTYKPEGRFPANLLLSHTEACVQVGAKQVKSDGHFPSARPGTTTITTDGHAGQQGLVESYTSGETVEVWECADDCPVRLLDEQTGVLKSGNAVVGAGKGARKGQTYAGPTTGLVATVYADQGGASRFFYNGKVSKKERNAGMPEGMTNDWPTIKPIALMEYLIKLITPPGGWVLDPFVGSGSTGVAAVNLGFNFFGMDNDPHALAIAKYRMDHVGANVETRGKVEY